MATQPEDKSILREIVRIVESRRRVPDRVQVQAREYVITYLEDHRNRLDEALRRYDPDRLNMLFGQLASKIKYQFNRMVPARAVEPAKAPAANKPAAKKTAAKTQAIKKAPAKNAPAKKASAKKAPAKKPVAKKPVVRKAPAKKAVAKTTAPRAKKKPATKRSAAKKATAKKHK